MNDIETVNSSANRTLCARWHHTPLYLRIIGALILGLIAGLLLGPQAGYLTFPSKLVLRLLNTLAPPLILTAVVHALIHARFAPGTAPKLLRLLLLNTLVAICIGLAVANIVRPGQFSKLSAVSTAAAKASAKPDPITQFFENIPEAILQPLAEPNRVLGAILIALAIGFALRKLKNRPITTVADIVEAAFETLLGILHWVIDLIPFAVFGIVAGIIGTKGFKDFHALGMFVVAVIIGLLLQAGWYLVRVRAGSWVKPADLLRGCRDALVMAFSTASSTATMPVTYDRLRNRVGLREENASLGALVGSNFNNDGTALYEAMSALFISQMLGMHMGLQEQLLVVVTSILASVGAAGIPEAGLVTMTLVFNAVHLPVEYIPLLLTVDWFLDRCRTAINVMGDMNVACLLDGRTRHSHVPINPEPMPD